MQYVSGMANTSTNPAVGGVLKGSGGPSPLEEKNHSIS